MNSKRGQLHSGIIRVFIIAIIIVLISYFGYKGFSKISGTTCRSELALFEKDLQVAARGISSQTGSVEEKKYKVPCKAERIYFVDLSAFATLGDESLELLEEYAEMEDSVRSGAKKNVFLIKNNEIIDTFEMGDLNIGPPYYDCYITKTGILDIYLEGKKGEAGILKKDEKFDCTFEGPLPVDLSDEDEDEFLEDVGEEEVIEEGCEIIREIVEIPGEEGVRVVINKTGTSKCTYFENIPKCAVKSLIKAIEEGEFPLEGGWEIFAEDPIIMWDFGINEDWGFYQILNKIIKESCKREFKGAPFKKGAKPQIDPGVEELRDKIIGNLGTVIREHIPEGKKAREIALGYLEQIVEHWDKPKKVKRLLENLEKLFEKYDVDDDYYEDHLECLEDLVEGETTCEE